MLPRAGAVAAYAAQMLDLCGLYRLEQLVQKQLCTCFARCELARRRQAAIRKLREPSAGPRDRANIGPGSPARFVTYETIPR